jgi:hypothetical protein
LSGSHAQAGDDHFRGIHGGAGASFLAGQRSGIAKLHGVFGNFLYRRRAQRLADIELQFCKSFTATEETNDGDWHSKKKMKIAKVAAKSGERKDQRVRSTHSACTALQNSTLVGQIH